MDAVDLRRPAGKTLQLTSDVLRADLAPDIGASLASLQFMVDGVWVDILRPATADALHLRNVREMACFPMAPFASLIHEGMFRWSGRMWRVRPNMPDRPHALHGDAWQHPWEVQDAGRNRAVLRYGQDGDRFPFCYEAVLTAVLCSTELALTLTVINRDREPMPAGIGFHPFFQRLPDLTLQFEAGDQWTRDSHGRVLQPEPCSEEDSFRMPRGVAHLVCNRVYDRWSRCAVLSSRSTKVVTTLKVDGALERLLLFSPADRQVLCVEPVSNLPDGFNRLAAGFGDSGARVLEPGESLSGTMRIVASLSTG